MPAPHHSPSSSWNPQPTRQQHTTTHKNLMLSYITSNKQRKPKRYQTETNSPILDTYILLLLLQLYPFNSRTMWVSRYQKGITSLDFSEARDYVVLVCSGISWTICKQSAPRSRQITTPTLNFLQAGCSSWHPTNSVKSTEGSNKQQVSTRAHIISRSYHQRVVR